MLSTYSALWIKMNRFLAPELLPEPKTPNQVAREAVDGEAVTNYSSIRSSLPIPNLKGILKEDGIITTRVAPKSPMVEP